MNKQEKEARAEDIKYVASKLLANATNELTDEVRQAHTELANELQVKVNSFARDLRLAGDDIGSTFNEMGLSDILRKC